MLGDGPVSDVFVNIGDTVHIAAPDDIGEPVSVITPPTIAALLAQSRAAHQRFLQAAGHNDGRGTIRQPDDPAAALAIQQAAETRHAAQAQDPQHTDPAWAEDRAAMKGVSSEALLFFYDDYFAPDVPL